MTDGEALLRAVLSAPAEDTPRLVYADWLEENGEPDRAAFIREAVRYPHCEFVRLTAGNPFELLGIPEPPVGKVVGPPSGNPQIDDANRRTWMWGETDDLGCVIHDLVRGLDYRPDRGFVSAVRCGAIDWLKHADTVAWHPSQTVACPYRSALGRGGGQCNVAPWCQHCRDTNGLPTGRVPRPCPPTAHPIRAVTLTSITADLSVLHQARNWSVSPPSSFLIAWWGRDVTELFRAEWPWVNFTFSAEAESLQIGSPP